MQVRKSVFLLHQVGIQHYRIGVYNYLSQYLASKGWHLVVVSGGIEEQGGISIAFDFRKTDMHFRSIRRLIQAESPDAVILFLNLRQLFLFPLILFLRACRIPVIYWGHAIDLEDKGNIIKRMAYALEHSMVDAMILYADHLRIFVAQRHQPKVFIANNTLNTSLLRRRTPDCTAVLKSHGIHTRRNILCVGRLQHRKGIAMLVDAFALIGLDDAGLILVGPDVDGIRDTSRHPRVIWLGPLYGDRLHDLMECADVYCMPGHVGLSIVDAFFFGLPLVTTDVDHAPEIAYLKHGVNGLMLPRDDTARLASSLETLLVDDAYRARLSAAAEDTIRNEASIETMCAGFFEALSYLTPRVRSGSSHSIRR